MTSIQIRIASPSLVTPVSLNANVERLDNGDHVITPYQTVGHLRSTISQQFEGSSLSLVFAGRIFNDSISLMEAFSNYYLPLTDAAEPVDKNEPVIVTVHAVMKFSHANSTRPNPTAPPGGSSMSSSSSTAASTSSSTPIQVLCSSSSDNSVTNPINAAPLLNTTHPSSKYAAQTQFQNVHVHQYYDQYYRNYYTSQIQAILSTQTVNDPTSPNTITMRRRQTPRANLRDRVWDRVRGLVGGAPVRPVAPEVMAAVNFGGINQPVQLPRSLVIARWLQTVLVCLLKWVIVSQLILRSDSEFAYVTAWVVGVVGTLQSLGWLDLFAHYATVTQWALNLNTTEPSNQARSAIMSLVQRGASVVFGLFASLIPGVHPLDPATSAAEHLRAMDILNDEELAAEFAREAAM